MPREDPLSMPLLPELLRSALLPRFQGQPRHDGTRLWSAAGTGTRAAAMACLLLTFAGFAWLATVALQRPPSFDGGMNLQVAESLAQGEGYRRPYGGAEAFPPEIQTNAPYLLPAAAVFRLFGTGLAQAQVVNLLYLAGLMAVAGLLLARRFGPLAGAAGAAMMLVTPGITDYGLGGYGEIPALFWALLALERFPWSAPDEHRGRVLFAGTCLGLALCTKTILLPCVAVFGATLAIPLLAGPGRKPERLEPLATLALGFLLPLVAMELWRLGVLRGDYIAWWRDNLSAVGSQAGVSATAADSMLDRLLRRFVVLSYSNRLAPTLTWVWLLPPLGLGCWCLARPGALRRHLVLAGLLATIGLYFAWWLLVTPEAKAWHRRILIGCLLLGVAWVYVAAWCIEHWRGSSRWLGWARFLPALALAWFMLHFARYDLRTSLDRSVGAGVPRAVALLRELPARDEYAIGWYSAPTLSLLSGRPFQDFNDLLIGDRDRSQPVYLVVDFEAARVNAARQVLATYEAEPLLPETDGTQVYRLHLDRPRLDGRPAARLPTRVGLGTADAPTTGFYRDDSVQGQWMSSQGFVRLRYEGGDTLVVALYTPPFDLYGAHAAPALRASIDGCPIGTHALRHPDVSVVALPIPSACRPANGAPVTVRLDSNVLIGAPTMRDDRALSYVVSQVGITGPCSGRVACQRALEAASPTAAEQPAASWPARLVAKPNPVDGCQPGPYQVTVSWDTRAARTGGVQIWVSAPGEPRKLWLGSGDARGAQATGPWVRDRTQFDLVGVHGELLGRDTVLASCTD